MRIGSHLLAVVARGVGLVLVACGGSSAQPSADVEAVDAIQASCTATTPPACTSTPHYADVAPIIQTNCVPCHPGPAGSAEWPLSTYDDNAPWAGAIQDELCANGMPPLDGGIAIPPSDRLTLLDWAQCGAPQ